MGREARNLLGMTFGRLTVQSLRENDRGNYRWNCACLCGEACVAATRELMSGDTQSCGCLRSEIVSARMTTHGGSQHPEYAVWKGMHQRCSDPNTESYARYGGRGIGVCSSWSNFGTFYADMGPRPSPLHTLERIKNDVGYSKANCVWATRSEQSNNTSRTHLLTLNGRTQSMRLWSEELSLSYTTIRARKRRGWDDTRALTEPIGATA